MNMANDNYSPFSDFLEYQPQAAYYSSPTGRTFGQQSPNRRRHFQDSFQNYYNQYLGELGSQLRAGQAPTMRFQDYLSTDPFTERYTAMTPQSRGEYSQQYNPRTRFIFY